MCYLVNPRQKLNHLMQLCPKRITFTTTLPFPATTFRACLIEELLAPFIAAFEMGTPGNTCFPRTSCRRRQLLAPNIAQANPKNVLAPT
jgi:hypothetical protein